MLFAWSRGAIGYNWYDLRNDGFDAKEGEHNYGLLTNDFYPKAVYAAYNELTRLFRTARFVRQWPAASGEWILEFADGSDRLLACWINNDRNPGVMAVDTATRAIDAIDIMGNCRRLPVTENKVAVQLNYLPMIYRFSGERIAAAGRLVEVVPLNIVPGRKTVLPIRVCNPLSREADFKLSCHLPSGLQSVNNSEVIRVASGGSMTVNVEIKPDAGYRQSFIDGRQGILEYAIEGTALRGQLAFAVIPAISLERNDFSPAATFTLTNRSQTVALVEANPQTSHLLWKGPEDLSAKVWLAINEQRLKIRVEVVDDIHNQPFHGSDIWQGDSVQLAIALPGRGGIWEIGMAQTNGGADEVFVWSAPEGGVPAALAVQIKLKTRRQGAKVVYDAEIPVGALGMTPAMIRAGFRFNLLVNDNDGEGREGWIQIAPGLGDTKDIDQYPLVMEQQ